MSELLKMEHVAITYGSGVQAVKDVSLRVVAGEMVALLGPNGAGKTTLMRALSGLLHHHNGRVSSGSIWGMGQNLLHVPGHKRGDLGITQTFEGRRILRQFTVEENLEAGGLAAPKIQVRQKIAELYERFPILAQRRRQAAGLLSGGEQQILAIARALVSDPKLLMLDEPSLGLAPIMIKQVAETIRAVRALGKTILLVEQNAHLALALADRAYVIQNGSTVGEGTAQELQKLDVMSHFYLGIGEGALPIRNRQVQAVR